MNKNFTMILTALIGLLLISVTMVWAQTPPPPPVNGPVVGSYVATPIDGGLTVLLTMMGYGIYRLRRKAN